MKNKSGFILVLLFGVASPTFSYADDWTPSYNQNGTKTFYGTGNLTNEQALRLKPTYEIIDDGFHVNRKGKVSFSGGDVSLVDKSKISKNAASKAIGKFIGRVAGPITVGMAIYDLAEDLGFFIDKTSSTPGDFSITKAGGSDSLGTSAKCNVAYGDHPYVNNHNITATKYCVPLLAGSSVYVYGYSLSSSFYGWPGASFPCGNLSCETGDIGYSMGSTSDVTPAPPVYATLQELEDAIAQNSGWPTSKTLEAFKQALPYADPVPLTPVSLTAPPSVSKPPVVKETPIPSIPPLVETRTVNGNPHGLPANTPTITGQQTGSKPMQTGSGTSDIPTKTETKSNYDPVTDKTTETKTTTSDPHTVKETTGTKTGVTTGKGALPGQPQVNTTTGTTTTTTTTTITNNVTNITATIESTETKPEDEDASFSDTELGDIPDLYERKYPDGLTGIWNEKLTAFKTTPLFTLGSQLMPSVSSSGSCPSWSLPLNIASWASYGAVQVEPPCWVWDFGRAVIIISSLLLARSLIFGG